ncbi:hypothetical protein BKA69DRAFT_1053671 [Paraphysoderma sedebokerense]|nr:hypothetical protein BKA69DRAFT_1053671 [Paraphysoderma sedebokerense]
MITLGRRKVKILTLLTFLIFSIYSFSATLLFYETDSNYDRYGNDVRLQELKNQAFYSKREVGSVPKADLNVFEATSQSNFITDQAEDSKNVDGIKKEINKHDYMFDPKNIDRNDQSNQIISKSLLSSQRNPAPISSAANSRYAYVTLLSSTAFLPGTLVLLESIYRTGTTADLIVLVLQHIPYSVRRKICGYGFKVIEVEYIRNPNMNMIASRQKYNFAKLRAWELDEYESIIVLGLC